MKMKSTTLKTLNGQITITHHQTVRQSHAYQTAEVSYGGTITVADDPKIIKAQKAALEALVEDMLVNKVQEQRTALRTLAEKNRD